MEKQELSRKGRRFRRGARFLGSRGRIMGLAALLASSGCTTIWTIFSGVGHGANSSRSGQRLMLNEDSIRSSRHESQPLIPGLIKV